ncbi:MAG: pyocin activator PrtN family protein, partial [Albidovulum sp.]
MKTLYLLMAMHDGQPILPPEIVCKDYFTHLTPEKFLRKISDGTIPLPLARMEKSQK